MARLITTIIALSVTLFWCGNTYASTYSDCTYNESLYQQCAAESTGGSGTTQGGSSTTTGGTSSKPKSSTGTTTNNESETSTDQNSADNEEEPQTNGGSNEEDRLLKPTEEVESSINKAYLVFGIIALAGSGVWLWLIIKKRREQPTLEL